MIVSPKSLGDARECGMALGQQAADDSSAASALELFFWNEDAEHMQAELAHLVHCLDCDSPAFPGLRCDVGTTITTHKH